MQIIYVMIAIFFPFVAAVPGFAYIGPGLGAGAISIALGIIGSFLLALFAVVWYPLKRIIKKIKARKSDRSHLGKMTH